MESVVEFILLVRFRSSLYLLDFSLTFGPMLKMYSLPGKIIWVVQNLRPIQRVFKNMELNQMTPIGQAALKIVSLFF